MSLIILMAGVIIGALLLAQIPRLARPMRPAAGGGALLVVLLAFALSSFRYVGDMKSASIPAYLGLIKKESVPGILTLR